MSEWDSFNEMMNEGGASGGKFINLKDGDAPITGVCIGVPISRKMFYTGKKGEPYIPWVEKERKPSDRPAWQFYINFWDTSTGTMRILKGSRALGISYEENLKKYGRETGNPLPNGQPEKVLDNRVFSIHRTGEKADTRYPFFLEPDMKPPAEFPEAHDLEEIADSGLNTTQPEQSSEASKTNDDLPF